MNALVAVVLVLVGAAAYLAGRRAGVGAGVARAGSGLADLTRLKEADEAKTLFLATASHELKTPLTVIQGFSQMLLVHGEVLTEDERLRALQAIDVRALELTGIVDRLLMSSRIEAGRIDLTPAAIDLAALLRERAHALEGATGRPLRVEVPQEVPPPWCDADALRTVIDHVVDNAVKYSPGGEPVTLEIEVLDQRIEVAVHDHGIGMTAAQSDRCFDRFWQAEATDVRRFGGTGIGLYIVRSLVEAMGGTVEVASILGEGSTFRVSLARADAVVPASEPAIQ